MRKFSRTGCRYPSWWLCLLELPEQAQPSQLSCTMYIIPNWRERRRCLSINKKHMHTNPVQRCKSHDEDPRLKHSVVNLTSLCYLWVYTCDTMLHCLHFSLQRSSHNQSQNPSDCCSASTKAPQTSPTTEIQNHQAGVHTYMYMYIRSSDSKW